MKRLALVLIPLSMTIILSSCGLFKSDTRSLKLIVKKYENHLSNGQYDAATGMCDEEAFLWLKETEEKDDDKTKKRTTKTTRTRKKELKGAAAATAFHTSIKKLSGADKVTVDISSVNEVKPGLYTVIGFMQVRQIESGSLRSMKWKMTMKWKKTGKGWKMIEFKERGPRESFRS